MCSDIAIQVRDLGKCFNVYEKPAHRLMQMLWRGRRRYYREFWALREVGFTIHRGETVGIIGRNGAGKSTLLQMICGTLTPTEGDITVNGRVAALLELGAGFNPEFSGRENVYLAASLYGVEREEVSRRFADIASFADIGDFIEQPVKTYSSGMYVRLAFAVIAHVDADILIIDEALSVGDAYFQQKCMRFLANFQRGGGTLLFVSHDMGAVTTLCASAVLLRRQNGQYQCDIGSAREISALYLRELYADRQETALIAPNNALRQGSYDVDNVEPTHFHAGAFRPDVDSFGAGGARIENAAFTDVDGNPVSEFTSQDDVRLTVTARALKPLNYPAIGFMLKDRKGQYLVADSSDSYLREEAIAVEQGNTFTVTFQLQLPRLIRGEYSLDLALAEGPGDDHVQHHWLHDAILLTALNSQLVHGIAGAQPLAVSFRTFHHS
ncbi:Vitamin B12 import ATP-binding protein BtuD [Xanthomonas sacchari]|uniref:ABC transporter ATP-binding protein n=1 Tax=Xanthomonas sacchari TaxID=56458 RepID=UPI00225E5EBE|nr:ABC transporter ATP-binding protein [Xanthomonas sacchari]MCW0459159.1 Vitamin B12 import ATP-binding protein BtuD [Xanthomonas sacchari]